jgi:hypothetical protein
MHREVIGSGLADSGRQDLDQPEDQRDLGHLVQHVGMSALPRIAMLLRLTGIRPMTAQNPIAGRN